MVMAGEVSHMGGNIDHWMYSIFPSWSVCYADKAKQWNEEIGKKNHEFCNEHNGREGHGSLLRIVQQYPSVKIIIGVVKEED